MEEIPNVAYALPSIEDPKLVVKPKHVISSANAKKYFKHWRKRYKLEGYEIYPLTSLRAARKQARLIPYMGTSSVGLDYPSLL